MKYDVAIIGAGLTGLSLGVALAGAGRQVAVLDARPEAAPCADAAFDLRIYAISPASAAWLGASRVWASLDAARIAPVYDMSIYGDSARAGVPGLSLSAYRAGIRELCSIVEERELARVLASAARFAPNLDILRPVGVASMKAAANAQCLTLADGRLLEADLVVGADGASSWVRDAAGIAVDSFDYRQTAVVANFDCERGHRGMASQWFRVEEGGGSGILAWLPLPGDRISIVWSAPSALAGELMDMDEVAFAERVAKAGMHALGGLTLAGPRGAFPLRNQRSRRLIAARVALVGDAAHVLHPLAGQGLNLGFGDCAELFGVLAGARDCGDASRLRAYERARKAALLDMHAVTHGMARLFASAHPAVRAVRNAGLNLAGRLPVVSNLLVRGAIRG